MLAYIYRLIYHYVAPVVLSCNSEFRNPSNMTVSCMWLLHA